VPIFIGRGAPFPTSCEFVVVGSLPGTAEIRISVQMWISWILPRLGHGSPLSWLDSRRAPTSRAPISRALPKSSPTDEYAKKIAQAIAKGRPPPFSEAFDRYCESSPGEIFAAFTGAARHMPPAGKDEPLAVGYLFVLQRLLEHLRYRVDRGYDDAAKLIADFQADVVAQVGTGKVDGRMLALVGGALHQSKIPAAPEFAAASAQHAVDRNEDAPLPTDIRAALAGIVEACDGDPFLAVGALTENSHALPAEARGALAGALAVAGGSGRARQFCFSSIRTRLCAAPLPAPSRRSQRR
jgi:hypothetical protein